MEGTRLDRLLTKAPSLMHDLAHMARNVSLVKPNWQEYDRDTVFKFLTLRSEQADSLEIEDLIHTLFILAIYGSNRCNEKEINLAANLISASSRLWTSLPDMDLSTDYQCTLLTVLEYLWMNSKFQSSCKVALEKAFCTTAPDFHVASK